MGRDVTYLTAGGSRRHSLTGLSRWLAIGLGGALVFALILAQSVRANHEAALSALTVGPGNTATGIDIGTFDGATTSYSATVEDARGAPVDKVTVDADPATDVKVSIDPMDADADTDDHQVNLAIGANTITVTATTENDAGDVVTSRAYTINITRISASDASLKALSLGAAGASLSPAFDADTMDYTASVKNNVETTTVAHTANHTAAAVSQIPSADPVPLAVGDNYIRVVVASVDGSQTRTYTVKVNREASDDGRLATLTASGVTLDPSFVAASGTDAQVTSYSGSVGNDVTSTTVAATKNHAGAKDPVISPGDADGGTSGHQINLGVGENVITVRVEAEDGSMATYTIKVTRAVAPSNADLSALSLSDGTNNVELSPGFAENITSYSATVSDSSSTEIDEVTVTATAVTDFNAAISPSDADAGTEGHQVALRVGDNTITVRVTGADSTSQTYTIKVTRVAATNAYLSSLTLSGVTLEPKFASSTTSYTASVDYDLDDSSPGTVENETTIAATAVNANVTPAIVGGATATLAVGENTIRVVSTSADGSVTKTYTVTVTRAGSDDATLTSLALDGLTLSPVFAADTMTYTAAATNDDTQTVVTATKAHADAKNPVIMPEDAVKDVEGEADTTGHQVNLDVGKNVITVMVEAEDGSMETYTVTVTRAMTTNSHLSALSLSEGTLDPVFSADATAYSATVERFTSSITVTATPVDGGADVVIMPADSDAAKGHQVALDLGSNTITVMVTASDGSTSTTTTISVFRNFGGAALSKLSLSYGTENLGPMTPALNPEFMAGTTAYSASVPHDLDPGDAGDAVQNRITVTYTAANNAMTEVSPADADTDPANGYQVDLDPGANKITISVTSSDGTVKTDYTVNVFRVHDAAQLTKLSLGDGVELEPEFSTGHTYYMAEVDYETMQVTVAPTAKSGGSASVMPEDADAEVDGHQVDLNEGNNTITVAVSHGSGDDEVTTTYTVMVNRGAAPEVIEDMVPVFSPASASVSLPAGGGDVSHQVPAATGGDGNLVYTSNAAAPLSFDASTRMVSGTVTASATVVVTATDEDGDSGTYTLVISVPVPGPATTVTVPGPTVTRTVTRTVTETVEVPAPPNVIGGSMSAMAALVDGRVLITRHDGGPSLVIDIGGFIRDASLGQTYQVVQRMDGMIVRQWVSPNSPLVYQIPWSIVNTQFTVPVGVIMAIPLDDQSGSEGQLVRRFDGSGDDRIFSYAGMGQWRHVPDIATFQQLGFYWCDVTAADSAFFDRVNVGPPHPASMDMSTRDDYPSCSTG